MLEDNRHEAPQKLRNSSLSIVLVDDLLLTCLDLVRLSRFQSRLKQDTGVPLPPPKKISLRFCTNPRNYPGGKWGGGSNPPIPPVASQLLMTPKFR
jgi:hypothetical protein